MKVGRNSNCSNYTLCNGAGNGHKPSLESFPHFDAPPQYCSHQLGLLNNGQRFQEQKHADCSFSARSHCAEEPLHQKPPPPLNKCQHPGRYRHQVMRGSIRSDCQNPHNGARTVGSVARLLWSALISLCCKVLRVFCTQIHHNKAESAQLNMMVRLDPGGVPPATLLYVFCPNQHN